MRKSEEDLDLMDRVHGFTFMKKPISVLSPVNDETMHVQQKIRAKLREAERFVIDDDAVRTITHLSREFKRMEGWSFLARLPYDAIWFEYNVHVKVREFAKMGTLHAPFYPEQVPPRFGYLMYREAPNGSSPRWVCQNFAIDTSGVTVPSTIAYVFDPEGDMKFPIRGSSAWNSPTLSLRPGFPKIESVIKTEGKEYRLDVDPEMVVAGIYDWRYEGKPVDTIQTSDRHMDIEKPNHDGSFSSDVFMRGGQFVAPPWLVPRMAVIIDPWWDAYFDRKLPPHYTKNVIRDCRENSGHLRWMLAMLASINGLPKTIQPRHFRPGKRSVGMNLLPFLRSSTVSITIPREDQPLKMLVDKLDRAANAHPAHRAAHNVRGHWRTIELGKLKFVCRHSPVMVESGLGICTKCELLVRWIDSYPTGDATVGVVTHDRYVVTT